DSVADGEIGTMKTLAAADIQNVRIGRSDGDRSDGLRGLAVEDRIPGSAGIVAAPQAAVDLGDVQDHRRSGDARHRPGAAAPERADHPPAQILKRRWSNLLGERAGSHQRDEDRKTKSHRAKLSRVEKAEGRGQKADLGRSSARAV